MFDSLKRGWGFFTQAIDMARKDSDLIKPSIFSFIANAIVGIVFAVPIVIVAIVLGTDSNFGRIVLAVLGGIMLFVQYTVTYVFSGMTVYLIYQFLTEGDGQMDKAWAVVQRDFLDIMSLAVVSAIVKMIENSLRGNRRGGRGGNIVGGAVAGIIETVWTTATYFVLPAMILENLNLWDSLKRATFLIKNNLLLVGVGFVGVSLINGLLGGGLVFVAIVVAVGIVFGLSYLGTVGTIIGVVLAIGMVVLVAGAVNVFTSYVATAYHTSLFLWARNAEKAQTVGQSIQSVQAPAPLAAVLGKAW
jgi:Family of unknown function (DUF6159)